MMHLSAGRYWTAFFATVSFALTLVSSGAMEAAPTDTALTVSQASGPKDYIVQFVGDPVASHAAKAGAGRVQAKQALETEHEQFRQDLAAMRNLPAGKAASAQPDLIRHEYYTVLNGAALTMTPDEAQAVAALPYVKSVQQDEVYRTTLVDSVPLVRADDVWSTFGVTGVGTVVAIIDTGIDYTHVDLGGGFGPAFKVIGGYDFYNDDADPMDDEGHGTHVAGIVAANGTLVGVAPDAKLLAYKVFGASGTGIGADVIAAIERACDPDQNPLTDDKVDVINMSLGNDDGAGDPNSPMALAANAAAALGVVCVASAGNDSDYRTIGAPACASEVLAVGATDDFDSITYFSSRGPALYTDHIKPEICAPGYNIVSAAIGGGAVAKLGTSMSCPHVSGGAALLRELYPTWTQEEIRAALVGTAVDIGEDVTTQGAGRMDIFAAADTEIIITPNPLNLGTGYDEVWVTDTPVAVTNVTGHSVTYSVSIDSSTLPLGASATIDPSITLAAGASGVLTLHLSVSPSVQQKLDPPYLYYGRVIAQSGGRQITIPFAFNRVPFDAMEPNNNFYQATPIALTDVRTQVGADGATVITPLQPGASDPDEDWYTFYARQGDKISAAIETWEILSPLGLPILEIYGDSLAEPLFTESNGDYPIVHRTPIIEVPSDGMLHLRVAGNPYLHTEGAYKLFISRLPNEVTLWKRLHSPNEEAENRMDYVPFITLSDSGDYLHVMQYAPTNYDKGPTTNSFLFGASSTAPIYTATGPYRSAYQASGQAGSTSVSVVSPRADLTTWTYDGLDWSRVPPANNPGRRYMAGMAFDSANGVAILFGGFDEAATTSDETWAWNGTTWSQRAPAHSPSPRYNPRMAYDASRGVVVLHGGETVDPLTGGLGNVNDTWEWDGTDWTEVLPTTVPANRSINCFSYDSTRHVVVMFGGVYSGGGGTANETWEFDGTDWTLRTTPTSAPFSFTSAMAYDTVNGEMLMCVDQETWAYDGVDWSQKVTANPIGIGEFSMVYDNSRSAMVLIAQPSASNEVFRTNRTYEWNGLDWQLVSTAHEPSKRAFFSIVFDSARNEVVFFGGWPLLTSTQNITVRQTPSGTPSYDEWLEFPDNVTGLGVSSDGTRIVDSAEAGDLRVRNGSGTVVDVISPPSPATLRSLSADGAVAVIEQAGNLVPFDINAEVVRAGVSVGSQDYMRVSADGTALLTAEGVTATGYTWSGAAYVQQWTFPIPDPSVVMLREAALSADGSLAVVVGSGYVGPGNPAGAVSVHYYFLNGTTGSLLHSYHKDIDPLNVLAGVNGQGFLYYDVTVNENGTLAAISDYSWDFSHSELAVFTPAVDQPILEVALPAPVTSMDMTGTVLAVGDGEEARENWADVLVIDLSNRLDDYDGDGLSNGLETNADADGDGIDNWLDYDSDGDGLSDAWESEHGLDPLDDGSINPDNGPAGDPDGDGRSNMQEFLNGFDPHNPDDEPELPLVIWPGAATLLATALWVMRRKRASAI